LLPDAQGSDPLAQDWEWVRQHMAALVSLTREFTARFAAAKRELAGVDFADLEQCALQLLRNPAMANEWRARLAQVFVDEYQDINAAQDAIITALSRTGAAANRFMVGDVKQSIYRFRLANPKIFGDYDKRWSRPDADGRRLPLTENFRSREALLTFVNLFFSAVMRPAVGGVPYEALQFGAPGARGALTQKPGDPPCVELHLIAKADDENGADEPASESSEEKVIPDLPAVQREARLLARRLRELKEKHHQIWDAERKAFRQVEWGDMAVLLRSPSGRAEAFAMEFSKAGVPLIAARDGFFASLEVSDLLNLLRLLDNPLQDVPLAAVLRSPLIRLTLDELAQVRTHND
jgi:ATP-dependent helicase/nuclease subunit A